MRSSADLQAGVDPPDTGAAMDADLRRSLWNPRKLAVQAVGFIIGLGLLAWCVAGAFGGDNWKQLLDAPPRLVAGLLLCSLISLATNAAIFWLVLRPVREVGFWNMQKLNLVTSVLNYAPIRLGLISRIAYHLRVDRLSILEVGGMLAAVGSTLLLVLGASVVATLIAPDFGLAWGGVLLGQLLLGGLLTRALLSQPIIVRYARGMERMLTHHPALWGAIGLRLIDIGAFVGRMACAAAIAGLALTTQDVVLLGMLSLALSLNPLGRFGYREAGVAVLANLLLAMPGEEAESTLKLLALVESAGEAAVAIPLGAICLFWYSRKWTAAGGRAKDTARRTGDPS